MGSLLGRGTFGSVFTALDTKSGMLIAIKRLSFCSTNTRRPMQARLAL
jgi:serine/threonine protein kinase